MCGRTYVTLTYRVKCCVYLLSMKYVQIELSSVRAAAVAMNYSPPEIFCDVRVAWTVYGGASVTFALPVAIVKVEPAAITNAASTSSHRFCTMFTCNNSGGSTVCINVFRPQRVIFTTFWPLLKLFGFVHLFTRWQR